MRRTRPRRDSIFTFHAFCEEILRENGAKYADPRRRRSLDSAAPQHGAAQARKISPAGRARPISRRLPQFFLALPGRTGLQRRLPGVSPTNSKADLAADRKLVDDDTFAERVENVALQKEIARAYKASEELLREKNFFSFGVAHHPALSSSSATDAALREKLQQRYKHILVDEFQDTNIAQLELLHLLAAEPRNIVAVGDNDQAIYRFRGASFGSFKLFLERFAGWKTGRDSTKYRVTLTENYRSTPNILRVATQVIAQNEVSSDFPNKVLSPTHPEGERIRIAELANEDEEARLGRRANSNACIAPELRGATSPFSIASTTIATASPKNSPSAKFPSSSRASPSSSIRSCATCSPISASSTSLSTTSPARAFSAAPAWHLEPVDLVRLAERTRKKRTSIYDVLQSPQSDLPFDPSPQSARRTSRIHRRAAENSKAPHRCRCSCAASSTGSKSRISPAQRDQRYVTPTRRIPQDVGAQERNAVARRNFSNISTISNNPASARSASTTKLPAIPCSS